MAGEGEGRGEGDAGGAADWGVLMGWKVSERGDRVEKRLENKTVAGGSIGKSGMLEQVELTEHRDEAWG